MRTPLLILLAALALTAGCSSDDGPAGNDDPQIKPRPEAAPWDGTTVTEPADLNIIAKTATIMRASDLAWLSQQSNLSAENTFEGWRFTLGIDLDLAGKQWTPISQWSNELHAMFKGSFDGDFHTIKGLYSDSPDKVNVGLFGLATDASVTNLRVEGSLRGKQLVGGIVANAQGATRITHCIFSGEIEGATEMGGICGWVDYASVLSMCSSSATIAYSGEAGIYAGGIAGRIKSTTGKTQIQNCLFEGRLVKRAAANPTQVFFGGIAGHAANTKIVGCKNTADIAYVGTAAACLGGIVGKMETTIPDMISSVTASYNTGAISNGSATEGKTGGISGVNENMVALITCYNIGVMTPSTTETDAGRDNFEINSWRTTDAIIECYYEADKPAGVDYKRFTAGQWPQPGEHTNWNIGNDPAKNQYWKSLGTPGTRDYPKLWWE